MRTIMEGVVNVKEFGAIGQGNTNDAVALQAAYDACRDGDTLYAPPGQYHFYSPLNWSANKAVHLWMPGVICRSYIESGAASITYGGADGASVGHLTANGPSLAARTTYAMHQAGLVLQNIILSDLRFGKVNSCACGVVWSGLNSACGYNRLRVDQLAYCVHGLSAVSMGKHGWTNELHHHNISWGHSNADITTTKPVQAITVPPKANGWTFTNCQFENATYNETDLYALKCLGDSGYVSLINCRFEKNGNANLFIIETESTQSGPVTIVNPIGSEFEFGPNARQKMIQIPGVGYSIGAIPIQAT